ILSPRRRAEEVHRKAPRPGDHRMEERRFEKDVRPEDGGQVARPSVSQWFAVWTRSRHEQVVREQLERKGMDAFLPTITKWSRWKDRKKQIDWPLFPGYCFAKFTPDDRLAVLKSSGVVSIVSFNGELAPIPDHEIDSIRTLIETDLQFDPCPMIKEGMMVEVTH